MRLGDITKSLLVVASIATVGCDKGENGGSAGNVTSSEAMNSGAEDDAQAAKTVSPSTVEAEVNSVEKVSAAVGLPDLKPIIEKPFPEGGSDKTICEAIRNTDQKDLWLRFGHILPMYIFGSVFVLEAGEKKSKEAAEAIRKGYSNGGYYARMRTCDDKLTLMYIFKFADNHESRGKIIGREDLVEWMKSNLKLEVLESYTWRGDQERLSDYCRADAEVCEELMTLNYMNKGTGLCSRALSLICDLSPGDDRYSRVTGECSRLPLSHLACLRVSDGRDARERCKLRIKEALCP